MARSTMQRFSAYLSIFNEWEMLDTVLGAVADNLDELVVVDGAPRLIAPALEAAGVDSEISDSRVYDAVRRTGVAVKLLTGLWEDDRDKAVAAFLACSNRLVLRLQPAEVLFFDPVRLDAFLRSGAAVATCERSHYLAPGVVTNALPGTLNPRRPIVFDRNKTDAQAHADCLWPDRAASHATQSAASIFATPVAFAAHLGKWRIPATATPARGVAPLTAAQAESATKDGALWLKGGVDLIPAGSGPRLRPSPLPPERELGFVPVFEAYLASLAALNAEMASLGRSFARDDLIKLDLSSSVAVAALTRNERLVLRFDAPIRAAAATVRCLIQSPPGIREDARAVAIAGHHLTVDIQASESSSSPPLRRVLELSVTLESAAPTHRFVVVSMGEAAL